MGTALKEHYVAIKHKRTSTANYTWQSTDLAEGQIGLNIADGTLHFKKSDNSIVELAAGGGGLTEIVQDLSPQLGGELDVQTWSITTEIPNASIYIRPNGTGQIILGNYTAGAVVTTNGSGPLTFNTSDNSANSGYITIGSGYDDDITISPNGNGVVKSNKTIQIQAQNELRFADIDNSNYIGFKAPETISANNIWILPSTDGTNGQVLTTNGSGTLTWTTPSAGGGAETFNPFLLAGM